MKTAATPLFRLFYLASTLALLASRPVRADDSGYWQLYTVRGPITQKLDWILYPEIISDEGASSLSYMLFQSGLRYTMLPWWEWGIGYAYVRARTSSGDYITQHWEQPEFTWKWSLAGVPMSWRHRMEIRQLHKATDRYRTRFGITCPRSFTSLKLTPYVSYEYFFDSYRMAGNQNRTIGGVEWPFSPQSTLCVYYLRQGVLGSTTWNHVSYVGTELRIRFAKPAS